MVEVLVEAGAEEASVVAVIAVAPASGSPLAASASLAVTLLAAGVRVVAVAPGGGEPQRRCEREDQPGHVRRDQTPSAETPHGRVGGQGRLAAEMGVEHA